MAIYDADVLSASATEKSHIFVMSEELDTRRYLASSRSIFTFVIHVTMGDAITLSEQFGSLSTLDTTNCAPASISAS